MKRNQTNPRRERKRRRRANGVMTKRERGFGKLGIKTPKRPDTVSPLTEHRRRRNRIGRPDPSNIPLIGLPADLEGLT